MSSIFLISLTSALAAESADVVSVSKSFLGVKYQNSPLGEGEGKDEDPRFRTDAFDCLTYVETVMAFTVSPQQPEPTLDKIRYRADDISYGERNHVMEAQWLPNNIKKGFLRDVTSEYGDGAEVQVKKSLADAQWETKEGRSLGLTHDHQARGVFEWSMIPASQALPKLDRAPDGTVVVVVRGDSPKRVTRISHVGFLVHKKDGLYLRHASRTFRHVVDERLSHYLKRNLEFGKWTVEGFSLFEVGAGK